MNKKIRLLTVVSFFAGNIAAQTIDIKTTAVPFDHYWSVGVGAGRMNEGLRASWLEQLETVKNSCGFKYVRMHGIFNDDMFVCFKGSNGIITYNWQYIDDVVDHILKTGVRPFVELSFFPKELSAENSKQTMWYKSNVSPDKNTFAKWHDLIKAFTQHAVDRYGIDEIRKWYFEVWNEPNLNPGFWDGTKSDYFRLYKESATAIKSVDAQLKVGGPATSNFVADNRYECEIYDVNKSVFYSQDEINKQHWKGAWIEDFLGYCDKENLPVDFISCHPYPTDYALDPVSGRGKGAVRYVNSLHDDMSWLKQLVNRTRYKKAEIHYTEWSTSPNSRDAMHDELPPAAYIIKTNLDCIGMANSLMYWTFTDIFEEKGGGSSVFHGSFGMINFQGIVKPSFHAYRMLNQLGDLLLYNKDSECVTLNSHTGKMTALICNYPKRFENNVPSASNVNNYMDADSKELKLRLKNISPNTAFYIEILDNEHGNVMYEYRKMGEPRNLSPSQVKKLNDNALNTLKETIYSDEKGVLKIDKLMSPWSCMLITEK